MAMSVASSSSTEELSSESAAADIQCRDFQLFQLEMKKLRFVDDRIVNELNSEISRDSDPKAKCQQIHGLILSSHHLRDSIIKKCIRESAASISDLRSNDTEDSVLAVRREQRRLRLFQNELNIEEIVKDRTTKAFYERCRFHYDASL